MEGVRADPARAQHASILPDEWRPVSPAVQVTTLREGKAGAAARGASVGSALLRCTCLLSGVRETHALWPAAWLSLLPETSLPEVEPPGVSSPNA